MLPIYLSGIIGIAGLLFTSKEQVISSLLGAGIGFWLFIFSKLLGGSIGEGDGLLLMSTGLLLGIKENVALFVIALFLACLFSILLILWKKAKACTTIPFVPFLLLAYAVMFMNVSK